MREKGLHCGPGSRGEPGSSAWPRLGTTGRGALCQFPALLSGGLSSQEGRTHLPRSGKTVRNSPRGDREAQVGLTSRSPPASPQSWHGGPGSSCPTPDKSFEWAGRRAVCDEGGHRCWSAPTPPSATEPRRESQAPAIPSPLTCRGRLPLLQGEAHPGLLPPPPVLTSILRTASSMAADVAAISLSTIAPSSS